MIVLGKNLSLAFLGLIAGISGLSVESNKFNSSLLCGKCHVEIYSMWRRSLHAGAFTDPIFQAAYSRAYLETEGSARELCLRCHAPAAFYSGDLKLSQTVSREGVTCDFCHSATAVNLQNGDHPFKVKLDRVKRGPLGNTASPAHEVIQSALHTKAEFCAGCHEYANEEGLLIFSTYSEWKLSPQAKEGKTCQHCHMPVSAGWTVKKGQGAAHHEVNLHNISGGHSSDQVRKAASLRILSLKRTQPSRATLQVEISNIGSGHSIPTGMPTRKLILEVELFAGGRLVNTLERSYQRVLLDGHGQPIREDHRMMLKAKFLMKDNRLRPGERRVESFVAKVPPEGALRASARLRYVYEPELFTHKQMSIQMVSDEIP